MCGELPLGGGAGGGGALDGKLVELLQLSRVGLRSGELFLVEPANARRHLRAARARAGDIEHLRDARVPALRGAASAVTQGEHLDPALGASRLDPSPAALALERVDRCVLRELTNGRRIACRRALQLSRAYYRRRLGVPEQREKQSE